MKENHCGIVYTCKTPMEHCAFFKAGARFGACLHSSGPYLCGCLAAQTDLLNDVLQRLKMSKGFMKLRNLDELIKVLNRATEGEIK